MTPAKRPPTWPSDDQVRELDGDETFTDDGRKLHESERVGGMAPDADPEQPRPRPVRPRRP
jgi:hypothetical protein